ncbi:chemotaxis protein CheW [Effusibacillus consociatus]|uniref:Chemotaxis protein CheW n=1 Tax=Effusibacillus consociatus TaxID=1117041 RepID=A0ABV9PZR4_9BACL
MATALDVQYVVIELREEKYALRIYDIYEVIKMQKITEVPNSKTYILGVINLRGKIVPIISLRKRFGLPEVPATKSTRIVVVNIQEEIIGIVVDGVNKVATFTDIQPPTEIVSGVDGTYFEGIGQSEEGLVSILKIDRVLYE